MIATPVSEVPYMVSVDDMQKENEERLKKEAERLFSGFNIEVEWLVRIGTPSDEIKLLTQEKEIDLVILATKGEGGLEKIIGSTTTNTIRKIKTPVLIIPQNGIFIPIKNISYASDFTYNSSFHLFNFLLELLKIFQASLTILHVHNQHEKKAIDELAGKKDIENIFKETDHKFHIIHGASVMHGINEFIEQNATDLLVMVAHKHTFLERVFGKSNTKEMAYETKVPLLVLQDKK